MEQSVNSPCCPHAWRGLQPGQKDARLYIILAIFFGLLGMHNFYAGYTGKFFVQLILSLTGIGAIVVLFWVILDIIFVRQDARRRPFVD